MAGDSINIGVEDLGRLLPMHLRLAPDGTVLGGGASIHRLLGDRMRPGTGFFGIFDVNRPRACRDMDALLACRGKRLGLRLRAGRRVALRGHLVGGDAFGGGVALLDLAFDLRELTDLGGTSMTAEDFSPTDPTLDMLYLIEAKTLAMDETRRLIDRLQGDRARAVRQAFTDTLTGVGNRRALDIQLTRHIDEGQGFAVLLVDLDYFKSVNDSHGHAAGDIVLRTVAERLCAIVRTADRICRLGGDEFVVLLPGLTDPMALDEIAVRIIAEIERPILYGKVPCAVSASIGIAISTAYDSPTAKRMFADSDAALYASKSAGRMRHTIHARAADPGVTRRSAQP